eukprot:TRINITY_DN1230_c0_g1_i3.p1 TRINITY_DN1230_c0_g1~~TRINITY_DN1230_c0_g1_i3.p1  ORF type:complete len:936 (+),score=218.52 TRINITY_DN1230_c0_g1_i3:3257-6064(+)
MNNNKLNGSLPDYMGDIFSLKDIQLRNNRLSGTIPSSFKNLTLLSLDLGKNSFSGTADFISGYIDLQSFDLSFNQFQGTLPSLEKFEKLGRILLNSNLFTGPIPSISPPYFNPLSVLDLSDNQLSGGLPYGQLPPQLRVFNVSFNQLTGYIPPQFSGFLILEVMDLSNNQLYGSLPSSLSRVTSLVDLKLDNNQFSGEIPSSFGSLTSLKLLSLSNNSLNSKDLSTFFRLINLETLDLSNNQIFAPIPEAIINVTRLQILDISNNLLYGSLPEAFFSLRNLVSVNLKNNNLSGNLSSFLSDPTFIDLSLNQFGGGIDSALGSLTSVAFLNLSKNIFVGEIPEISFKKQLIKLDLSRNFFSGSLKSFGGLTKLVHLDLSSNQLSGDIPSFEGDTSLASLNLRNNQFNDSSLMTTVPPTVSFCDISHNLYECPVPIIARNKCGAICIVTNEVGTATGRIRIEGNLDSFNSDAFLSVFSLVMNVSRNRVEILNKKSGSVILDLAVKGISSGENDGEGSAERIVYLMGTPPYVKSFSQNGIQVLESIYPIPDDPSTQNQNQIIDNTKDNSLSKGQIAGIAVGISVFILVVIAVVVVLLVRLKKARDERFHNQFSHIDMSQLTISSTAKNAIIDFDDIKNREQIGAGAFGVVYKAEWRGINVAVKQIRAEHVTTEQVEDFLSEVGILQSLRAHPNVVLFLGITIPPQPLALIIELCEGGSLYSYLRSHPMALESKIKLLNGIAKGMLHLHLEKVIHRDLAVRNILLTKFQEPKVADFGLSRQLDSQSSSVTNSNVGPLMWMSPEAIQERKYSNKSDSWSFGVVIWEILTVQDPFANLTPVEAAIAVVSHGLRLAIPEDTPSALSILMKECWNVDPDDRPDFEQINLILSALEKNENIEEFAQRFEGGNYQQLHLSNEKEESEDASRTDYVSLTTGTIFNK